MAGGIDWFRWHHGTATDPKFSLVAKKAGASVAEVLAVWVYLLESASAAEQRGQHGPIDWEAVAHHLGIGEELLGAIYRQFCDRGLVDHDSQQVTSWDRRQPKREREDDNSTARVQAFRARQRQETPGNATPSAETPRGEERREEEKRAPKEERESTARASRLPQPFVLSDDYRAFCIQARPDLNPDAVAEKFADYWHSKPGKAGTKTNWLATWRNWVREERAPAAARTGTAFEPAWRAEQRQRTQQAVPGIAARDTTNVIELEAHDVAPRRLG